MASLNLHPVKPIVIALFRLRGPSFARLPLRRQPAADAAALRLGLALGAGAVDDLFLLIDADDHVADHLVDHFEPPVELLHQLAVAVDHLEDVDAFLELADLVGQLAPSPVLGLLDLPVQARDDRRDLIVEFGALLFGGVRRENVNELVLPLCHNAPCGLTDWCGEAAGWPQGCALAKGDGPIQLSPDRPLLTRSSPRRSRNG